MLPGLKGLVGFALGGTSGSLSLSSPSSISRTGTTASLTTLTVTITATGGAGGYTHAWTSADAVFISANSPSAATTSFSALLGPGDSETAIFTDTVHDSVGETQTTTVTVTITRTGFS